MQFFEDVTTLDRLIVFYDYITGVGRVVFALDAPAVLYSDMEAFTRL